MPTVAELSVVVELDGEQEVTAGLRRLEKLINDLTDGNNDIPIETDVADVNADLKFVQETLFDIESEPTKAEVEADTPDVQLEQFAALLESLDRRVTSTATFDKASAEADIVRLEKMLEGIGDPDINADFDISSAAAKILELKVMLSSIQDKDVKVDVDRRGVDHMRELTAAASRAATQVNALTMAILVIGPALAPIGAVALTALAALTGGLLAAAAGAALFGAVAVSNLSPVVTAVQDLDKAQEAYNNAASSKEAEKQLAKIKQVYDSLDPAQRAVVEGFFNLRNAWRDFAAQFQPAIFEIAGRGMNLLAKQIPLTTSMMQGMVTSARDLMGSLERALASPFWKTFMTNMSTVAGPVMTSMLRAIGNLIIGIFGILNAFMPMTMGVVNGFEEMTAKFAAWGTGLATNPGFKEFISYVRTNIPAVLGFIKSLWGALVAIAQASAPIGTQVVAGMVSFFDTLSRMNEVNPNLLTLSLRIAAVSVVLVNLLGPVLAIGRLFVLLGNVFGAVSAGFGALSSAAGGLAAVLGISVGWVALIAAAIVALVVGLIYAYNHFEGFRSVVQSVVGAVKTFVVNAFTTMVPIVVNAFQRLVAGAQAAWAWITATLGPAVAAVVDWVVTEFNKFVSWGREMMPQFQQAWSAFAPVLSAVLNLIISIVQGALAVIVAIWNAVWPALVTIFRGVWAVISGVLSGAFAVIRGIITVFFALLNGDWSAFWSGLGTILGGIWTAIWGIIRGAWLIIVGIFQAGIGLVKGIWNGAWAFLGAVVGPAIDAVVAAFQWLWNILVGNSIIPDLVNAIIQWFQTAVAFLSAVFQPVMAVISAVWNAIKTVITTVVQAIVTIITTQWNLISTVTQTVWNAIKTLISSTIEMIKTIINTFITVVKASWQVFWTTIGETVVNKGKAVINAVKDIITNIKNALTDLIGKMVDFGARIVNGLINGIKSVAGNAVGAFKSYVIDPISNLIPGSPAKEGPFSGDDYPEARGRRIIEDLTRGASDRGDLLARTMTGLMSAVANRIPSTAATATAVAGGAPVNISSGAVVVQVGSGGDVAGARAAFSDAAEELAAVVVGLRRR